MVYEPLDGVGQAEAADNVAAGYGMAVITQLAAFTLLELQMTLSQNMQLPMVFTTVSLVRS